MLGGAVLAAAAAAAEVARAALQGTLPVSFRTAAAVAASSRSRRFQRRVATAACVGAGVGFTTCPIGRNRTGYCSPRHRIAFTSRNEG
jgi:hypothetical protein